jgi:hypothetical protein
MYVGLRRIVSPIVMFRRWGTGHNLGAGVLGGLLLSHHAWTVALIAFTLGLAVGSFAHLLRGLGDRLRRKPFLKPELYDQEPPLYVPWEFTLLRNPARGIIPAGKLTPTGEPGVRVDESGREWYSAAWL